MALAVLELTKIKAMIRKFIKRLFGKKYEEISFRQSYDLTELAIITFYQGDNKINLILDSGSSDNIIDKSALAKLEYEKVDKEGEIIGLTGNISKTEVCNLKVTYKNTEYEYPYMVADLREPFERLKKTHGVTLHGIIGTNFFNKYKYVLDFEKLVAYSKI